MTPALEFPELQLQAGRFYLRRRVRDFGACHRQPALVPACRAYPRLCRFQHLRAMMRLICISYSSSANHALQRTRHGGLGYSIMFRLAQRPECRVAELGRWTAFIGSCVFRDCLPSHRGRCSRFVRAQVLDATSRLARLRLASSMSPRQPYTFRRRQGPHVACYLPSHSAGSAMPSNQPLETNHALPLGLRGRLLVVPRCGVPLGFWVLVAWSLNFLVRHLRTT